MYEVVQYTGLTEASYNILRCGFFEVYTIQHPVINDIKDPKERLHALRTLCVKSKPLEAAAYYCPYVPQERGQS